MAVPLSRLRSMTRFTTVASSFSSSTASSYSSSFRRQGSGGGPRGRGGRRGGGEEDDRRRYERREKRSMLFEGEGVYGLEPVRAAIESGRREFYTLYVQEGLLGGEMRGRTRKEEPVVAVATMAEEMGLSVVLKNKHDLNHMAGDRPHQGVVLDASPLECVRIDSLPVGDTNGRQVWLALDEVQDPHNLGALLRSAHFLGADGVVVCAKNSAPLSPAVSKASAGTMEANDVYACSSMPRFLSRSQEQGWEVVGASSGGSAESCHSFKPTMKTLLILGNEGAGLRPVVSNLCTRHIMVPTSAPATSRVDSLNVSVAGGILLHSLIHT